MTNEQNASAEVAKHSLSIETAVSAISSSLTMGRKALNTELAVCLAIFAAEGNSEKGAKEMVVEVYVKAGYEAKDSNSRHYKTVNRRVNAAAGLYNMVGAPTVLEWIGKANEDKMLTAILKGLDTYKFSSMDDVLEFSGRPSNRTAKPQEQGDATGEDNQEQNQGQEEAKKAQGGKKDQKTVRFSVGKVKVDLPETMASEDMVKLASKILRAARDKEQEELRQSLAHPSTAPNPTAVAHLH